MTFDLQRFDGEVAPEPAPETPAPEVETPADDVQSKIDAATAKLKSELETERKKREADAKREAERLSKLSDDERRKAELEDTRRELEQQRVEFEREKIRFEAAKVLGQRNLPIDFVDYFIAEDNPTTLQRITTFEKAYRKAIESAVTERLKGRAPVSGGKTVEADSKGASSSFMQAIFKNQIHR